MLYVTKAGNPKCMCVLFFVEDTEDSVSLRNVTFFPSLEAAKSARNEAVSKIYSGPDIDSINDDLF